MPTRELGEENLILAGRQIKETCMIAIVVGSQVLETGHDKFIRGKEKAFCESGDTLYHRNERMGITGKFERTIVPKCRSP